jgi:thiaminase/transcriptional activator TenA
MQDMRDLWTHVEGHPFVAAAGDGSLDPAAFDRWLVQDYAFVVGFRRFLAGLLALAPDEQARDVLVAALPALQAELELFRTEAVRRGLDLGGEPNSTTLGYTSFVQASLQDGYEVALTVLYGAERAYFDAWSTARRSSKRDSAYWPFIDNWSSESFGAWVARLASLLDTLLISEPSEAMRRAFGRVVRFELRFWDAAYANER